MNKTEIKSNKNLVKNRIPNSLFNLSVSLISIFLSFFSVSSFANTLKCHIPTQIEDFSLYAIEDINAKKSDVHGSMGSGGSIDLDNYTIHGRDSNCQVLSASKEIILSHFAVLSPKLKSEFRGIESGENAHLNNALIWGSVSSLNNLSLKDLTISGQISAQDFITDSVNTGQKKYLSSEKTETQVPHSYIIENFLSKSFDMSQLKVTSAVLKENNALTVSANQNVNVVTLADSDFTHKNIIINGSSSNQLIINLTAEQIKLWKTNVILNGVPARNIIWNLPNATLLQISNTTNAMYGLPGRFYAPHAVTYFNSGRITGGLYVKSLKFNKMDPNLPTGQINNFDPPPAGLLN